MRYISVVICSLSLMSMVVHAESKSVSLPEPDLGSMIRTAVSKQKKLLKTGQLGPKQAGASPELLDTTGGVGTGVRFDGSKKTGADMHGTLSSRVFLEGSSGRASQSPDHLKISLTNEVASTLKEFKHQLEAAGKDANEIARVIDKKAHEAEQLILAEIAVYKKEYEAKPTARPMVLFEGDARYNMVGSSNGTSFTGGEFNARLGVGGSLKKHGEPGAHLYIMGVGSAQGQGYWRREDLNRIEAAVGMEQGLHLQVGSAVACQASPSVQLGKVKRGSDKDTQELSGVNFVARARCVFNNRGYVAGEWNMYPEKQSAKSGEPRWRYQRNEVIGNVRVYDQFHVGGRVRHSGWKDLEQAKTGNASKNETYVGLEASAGIF